MNAMLFTIGKNTYNRMLSTHEVLRIRATRSTIKTIDLSERPIVNVW